MLLIAGLALGWREKAVGKPLLLAAGVTVGGIAGSALVAFIATLLRAGDFWRAYPLVTYLALYAVLLATMVAALSRWRDGIDLSRMRAAAWLLILIFGAALSMALPGATIFFLFGPAVALAGIAISRRSPQAGTVLLVLAALIQFLMFAELLALIEMLLIDGPLWAVAPLAALAALPLLVEVGQARLRPALALLALTGAGLWTAALLLPRSSAERPASFSIDYFRDADHQTASWGIASKQAPLPASFHGEWKKGVLPFNGRGRWISQAPLLGTPTPDARLISNEPAGKGRRIRIALSPGGGDAVTIRFAEATKLLALGLPAAPETIAAKAQPAKAILRCSGRSCEGFVIEALLADRAPVEAELFSYRFSLPPEGKVLQAARPRNAIPQYSPDETVTLKRVRF